MTQTLVLAGHQQPLQCKVVSRPGPCLPAPSLTLELEVKTLLPRERTVRWGAARSQETEAAPSSPLSLQ